MTFAERREILASETPLAQKVASGCNYDRVLLATQCGCSVRQLERTFKAAGRHSPHLWLREQKWLGHMVLLKTLSDTGKLESIKRLALELGYRHPENFVRDFRRVFGVPPKRFLAKREKALKSLGINVRTCPPAAASASSPRRNVAF